MGPTFRQARARVKGGQIHLLHFQTGAARLLARLTAGRDAGPVFLTETCVNVTGGGRW